MEGKLDKKYIWAIIGLIVVIILLSKNIPKQTIVSAECNQMSDCPIPTKNSCPNFLVGCIANQCAYDKTIPNGVACGNELVTILMQQDQMKQRTEIPPEGDNVFVFNQNYLKSSFNIGDKTFTATQPKFLCQIPTESDFLNAPSPSSDCWKTDVNYGNILYSLKDMQTISIEPLINVQYFASGKLTRGEFRKPDDWSNAFAFTIDTPNALRLNIEDSSYVLKDSQKKIKINLLNNMPNGEIMVKLQQTAKQINQNLPEQTITKMMNKGNNELEMSINTNNYGINQILIQMFYIIYANNKVYIPSNKFIINYNIVDKIPNISNPIIVDETPSQLTQPENTTQKIKNNIVFLWIGLAFIGLLLLKKLGKNTIMMLILRIYEIYSNLFVI